MSASRREFIKRSVYGLLALFGAGFLIAGIRLLVPENKRSKELVFFPLISEDEIPRVGVKKAELLFTVSGKERKSRVFIISAPDDSLTVLSATCSHLGCLVNYNRIKREFICPCHGGRYDLMGKNIAGPPPAPLTRFPVRKQDGMVFAGIKI